MRNIILYQFLKIYIHSATGIYIYILQREKMQHPPCKVCNLILIIVIEAACCFDFSSVSHNSLLLQKSARTTPRCCSFISAFKVPLSALSGLFPSFQCIPLDSLDSAEDTEPEREVSEESQSLETSHRSVLLPYRGIFRRHNYDVNRTDLLHLLPHDVVCMVDSILLVYYHHEDIAGWKEWVDEHYRLGRRVYMLDFAAEQAIRDWAEFGLSIPECFQILKYEPKLSEGKLQKVLNDSVSAIGINCDLTPVHKAFL